MILILLWLMLPSVGLVTYVQYASGYYKGEIRGAESNIQKTEEEVLEKIKDNVAMKDLYSKIGRAREDKNVTVGESSSSDGPALIIKNIVIFIISLVFFQAIIITVDILYPLFTLYSPPMINDGIINFGRIVSSFALWWFLCVFYFYLCRPSILIIEEMRKEWKRKIEDLDRLELLKSLNYPS